MPQTVIYGKSCVSFDVIVVKRLQKKLLELKCLETLRLRILLHLRIHEFELMTCTLHNFGAAFRTNAQPVDAVRRRDRTVTFDADLEADLVQRVDCAVVQLQ